MKITTMPQASHAQPRTKLPPPIEYANDNLQVKRYTLPNGLQLWLSINPTEPRIFTNIAFRVGSKYDPANTTGLAHYMEHILFKGTSRIGALDWDKEVVFLERIADLFEQHRQTTDAQERRELYAEIDRLSYAAAQLAVPGEYDRLVSAIGAKDTNAYTWVDQTVYVNNIPSNELDRWLQLERERFNELAIRLFHTELETVYEEFNISQDRDGRLVQRSLSEMLFPNHPYGQQTTIGTPEHLKNPSVRAIQEFFRTYYVPNNMAIMLSGDLDLEETVELVNQYFGHLPAVEFPAFVSPAPVGLAGIERREMTGHEAPYVTLAWPLPAAQERTTLQASLVQHLLHNDQAGLLDVNLNQQQRVLEADAWLWVYEDHGAIGLSAKAREGQTLAEVEVLLLAEIDKLQRGDFADWLVEACINDFKAGELRAAEANAARVGAMTMCFVTGIPWKQFVDRYDYLDQLTKADIMDFARQHMPLDRYAVVHKLQGEPTGRVKVDKPTITPVQVQGERSSDFAQQFVAQPVPSITPEFVELSDVVKAVPLGSGVTLDYVHNPLNPLFRLDYIFEMGKNNSRELSLALLYLPYLGTSRYTASQVQEQFFRLGLQFDISQQDERSYLSLTGLEENMEEGLQLLEHLLADAAVDKAAWQLLVDDVIVKREHAKLDRRTVIGQAMLSYAHYGPASPFTHRLTVAELRATDPAVLVEWIRSLASYHHRLHYYGQRSVQTVVPILQRHHRILSPLQVPPPPTFFVQQPTLRNRVLFVHFPIVQTDLLLTSRGTPHFSLPEHSIRDLYNEYFGYGLSSVVFQEVREAKALAYQTYAMYTSPQRAKEAHYLNAYVGTQPDKVHDALPTLLNLLEYMPVQPRKIEEVRTAILRRIESTRLQGREMYWALRSARDWGYTHDLRRDVYERMQQSGVQDLENFHAQHVAGRAYDILLMGDRATTDLNDFQRFGPVQELSLEDVFGY